MHSPFIVHSVFCRVSTVKLHLALNRRIAPKDNRLLETIRLDVFALCLPKTSSAGFAVEKRIGS
jgi:hypothetical protein